MNNEGIYDIIPEFKMYITDLKTDKNSKEIDVSDLFFNNYIEFEFGDYNDEDYSTLPFKDFKFFINDYSITIYSPQIKELQRRIDKAIEYMPNLRRMSSYDKDEKIDELIKILKGE